jgi:hypothetical protein
MAIPAWTIPKSTGNGYAKVRLLLLQVLHPGVVSPRCAGSLHVPSGRSDRGRPGTRRRHLWPGTNLICLHLDNSTMLIG